MRFGDPETQVVLPLLADDAAALFLAVANGELDEAARPAFTGDAAVCVVLASQGYPESPRTGDTIEGLDVSRAVRRRGRRGDRLPRRHPPPHRRRAVLHGRGARARRDRGGADAGAGPRASAYAAAAPIDWEGMQMRHDIAALVRRSARCRRGRGVR